MKTFSEEIDELAARMKFVQSEGQKRNEEMYADRQRSFDEACNLVAGERDAVRKRENSADKRSKELDEREAALKIREASSALGSAQKLASDRLCRIKVVETDNISLRAKLKRAEDVNAAFVITMTELKQPLPTPGNGVLVDEEQPVSQVG